MIRPNSTPNNVPGENDQASQVIGATQIDLSVGKTVDNPTPNLNDTITFTVLVSNAGPSDATGVEVQDVLPAGLSFLTATSDSGTYVSSTGQWILDTIPNQGSAQLQIQARVDDIAPATNTAQVMKPINRMPIVRRGMALHRKMIRRASRSRRSRQICNFPRRSIMQANVGENVTFTIVVSNSGPDGTNVEGWMSYCGHYLQVRHCSSGNYNAGTGV